MVQRVEGANEISINAVRYRTRGPVRRFLASQPPARIEVGEAGPRSGTKSVVHWTDWRGGIGIQRMDPARDSDRCWWSTCNLRQKRHLTLPRLTTTTAASGVAGGWAVGFLNERLNVIYAGFGTAVRSYNNTTDSWGSTLATLPAVATDSLNIRLGGVEYLVIATTGGYTYFDGTTWTDDTKDTQYLVFWDNRLWGIDSTGLLWSSGTIGVEEDDAQLPLPNSTVTNLFLARAPGGDVIIYAATTNGVYAHDADGKRFIPTELTFPTHPDAGLGATTWRDAAYISAGLGVFKQVVGNDTAVVTLVGPDQDHGLPAAYRGTIAALIPTQNDLLALLDATAAPSAVTRHMSGVASNAEVIQADTGRAAILAWDGRGWQVLWTSAGATQAITAGHVSNAYSNYRVWWAQNQRVYWQRLPRDIVNPDELTTEPYAASSTHETPWYDGDETHTTNLGVVLCVDATGMSANETAAIRYRINFDDLAANQTTVGTIVANGHTEYLLPNATTPEGVVIRQIKFVVDLARGSTTTLSPDVNRFDFYFTRKEDPRWGVAVTLMIPPGGEFGQSAEQMYDNIVTAAGSGVMVQVTWRNRAVNEAGTVNPYNYYMDVVQMTGVEETGQDFSGEHQVVLVQR